MNKGLKGSFYAVIAVLSMNYSTAVSAMSCDQEILRVCPAGYVDGCTIRDAETRNGLLTTEHVCVKKHASPKERAGVSCQSEMMRVCKSDEIDACVLKPMASEKHICVLAAE